MSRTIGVISLVLGILLLIWGHNIATSVDSQVKQIFTGSPVDQAMYFYVGGTALGLFGFFGIIGSRK